MEVIVTEIDFDIADVSPSVMLTFVLPRPS